MASMAHPAWEDLGSLFLGIEHGTGFSLCEAPADWTRESGQQVPLRSLKMQVLTGVGQGKAHFLGASRCCVSPLELSRRRYDLESWLARDVSWWCRE